MSRILVVDDEPQLRRALAVNLRARGYEVVEAATGEAALQAVASERPDLVVLDLGLPGIGGLQVIAGLRGWTDVPIIVLTVRDDQATKVRALDLGADDYVTKPFGMDEFLARIRAALRRHVATSDGEPIVELGRWRLDLVDRTCTDALGESAKLTPTEWAIVEHLVRHPHRLVSHRNLIDAVWGPTADPDPNLLRVHLAHIRHKLERDPSRPAHLVTEPGLGYRYEP